LTCVGWFDSLSFINISPLKKYDNKIDRLIQLGYKQPSPVQVESFKVLFDGESAVIESETGSGKTLAYSIPLISQVDPLKVVTQGIIIVPTRELGMQVKSVVNQLVSGERQNHKLVIFSLSFFFYM
jgi:superfamily II DNA/RNA helicase